MLDKYVEEYINGNTDAFDQVYISTQKMVYSVCLSYVRDRSLAEDMMEETYISALKHIDSYKIGTSVEAWLGTIARNKCINEIKKRKRITYVGDYYDNEIIDESNDDLRNESIVDESPLLNVALKILNEKELLILLGHIIDGKQLVDIAHENNLPEGTVRWRYNNALNKIRKHLEREKIKNERD